VTDTPNRDGLFVCVEDLFANVDGQEVLCKRGSRWRGEVVDLHPEFFVADGEADEPALAKARAALAARIEN
jgi:hypothetical protein